MKIESEIKLSDIISWVAMLLVAGTIYGVNKVEMIYARRDIDADHASLQKLTESVYSLASKEDILSVLVGDSKLTSGHLSGRVEEK